MTGDGTPLEPLWLIAANVVRWRRYGVAGQELRPGTKSYRAAVPAGPVCPAPLPAAATTA